MRELEQQKQEGALVLAVVMVVVVISTHATIENKMFQSPHIPAAEYPGSTSHGMCTDTQLTTWRHRLPLPSVWGFQEIVNYVEAGFGM